jgi:hypothetical protein
MHYPYTVTRQLPSSGSSKYIRTMHTGVGHCLMRPFQAYSFIWPTGGEREDRIETEVEKGKEEYEDWKRVRKVKPIKKTPIKFCKSPVKIKGPIEYVRETKAFTPLNHYIPCRPESRWMVLQVVKRLDRGGSVSHQSLQHIFLVS